VVGLKAINCQTGDTLAQEQVIAASKEKVLDALGEAAAKLRGELGESLASVQKFDVRLAQITTPSLEALKEYSLAKKAGQQEGGKSRLLHDLRAIQLDPNFAMAYWSVAADYNDDGQAGRAVEYYTKGFQLREHASEWEKLWLTANYYQNVTGELDKAGQIYQEMLGSYPRDGDVYGNLGQVFNILGQYEKGQDAFRRALALKPDWSGAYDSIALDALALQRFDEARQLIYAERTENNVDDLIPSMRYILAFFGKDSTAMAEQQQWFADKPEFENFGLALASDTEAYGGHLGKARELTKRAVDSAIRADQKENGALWQANAALGQAAYGKVVEARQSAAAALKLVPDSQGVEVEAALAFAIAGDTARAESLSLNLGKRFPLDSLMQSLWLPTIHAQLALDRKNSAAAVNSLPVTWIELGATSFGSNISCLDHVYVRGGAYLAAGQGKEAAAEFQKILDHSGIVWNCWTGALAHLGVARANALQSRSSQGADANAARVRALAAYKDFLTLWKDADPDIPILKQAKAEYAKLQ
jgi:eukaryotic-like serine/threonine-protein kinase